MERLVAFPGVTVWEPSAELDELRGKSRAWKEDWLGNFFEKPCNNELFVRQSLNMEIAIAHALAEGLTGTCTSTWTSCCGRVGRNT